MSVHCCDVASRIRARVKHVLQYLHTGDVCALPARPPVDGTFRAIRRASKIRHLHRERRVVRRGSRRWCGAGRGVYDVLRGRAGVGEDGSEVVAGTVQRAPSTGEQPTGCAGSTRGVHTANRRLVQRGRVQGTRFKRSCTRREREQQSRSHRQNSELTAVHH